MMSVTAIPEKIPDFMKAAVLVEPGRFEIRDVPVPDTGLGMVLIKVDRCGICGTDIHIFNGHYASDQLPLIPGHEFCGIIVKLGEDVNHLEIGQKVVADTNVGCGFCFYCRKNEILNCEEVRQIGISRDGAFAEYIVVPSRLVIGAPADAPSEVLALTEPLACVVRATRKANVQFAQSVVILGAGPIGNLHIQMMRLVGAAPIISVELSPFRAELALKAGADAVVSDPEKISETVLSMTQGRGADLVIESVGSPQLYAQALELIRPGGHVAAFGLTGPDDTVTLPILKTILNENSIKGSVAGMGEDMHDALTLLLHGRFDTEFFTSANFPLEDIQLAFDTMAERQGDLKTQISF